MENPIGPNDLSNATIVSEVNDELLDEDKLNEIRASEPDHVEETPVQEKITVEPQPELDNTSQDL